MAHGAVPLTLGGDHTLTWPILRDQEAPRPDPSGNTALIGANLLYERLCVLPGVAQTR